MKRILVVVTALSLLAPAVATAQSLPDGWRMEQRRGETLLHPPGLKAGEVFVVAVLAEVEPRGRSLKEWFVEEVKRDVPRQGKVINPGKVEAQPNGALGYSAGIERRGERLILLYMAAPSPRGKHQMVRVTSSPDPKVFQHRLVEAGDIISGKPPRKDAARHEHEHEDEHEDEDEDEREAPTRRPPEPKPDRTAAYRTEPGRGIQPSQIEGVLAQMTIDPGLLGMGVTMPSFEPVLLLKNGEYCSRLDLPAMDMNAAAHKQARPGAWGKWRRRGRKYQRTNAKGEWIDARWDMPLFPARPGDKVSGTYSMIGGAGNSASGGGVSVNFTNSITFLPDGTFKGDQFGSTTIAQSENGQRGSGVSGVITSKSESDGRYRLDHGVLELRYNDGRVERRALNWGSKERKGSMFLNTTLYTDKSGTKKRKRR
jgi:hypothetical protein